MKTMVVYRIDDLDPITSGCCFQRITSLFGKEFLLHMEVVAPEGTCRPGSGKDYAQIPKDKDVLLKQN